MAQADPAASGTSGAPGVSAPDVDLDEAAAANFKTYTSPADRSVRKTLPTAGNKAAAAPMAEGAVAANPDLAVALGATSHTAYGLELKTTITSAPASLKVTIIWGDGTTDTADAAGSTELLKQHTYAEVGEYAIKVTVTDAANNVTAENDLYITTPGSDFTPYTPTRLLDTRSGIGAPKGKVPAYGTTRVKVEGSGSIPDNVTAVVLNVTVTNTTSGGHITAYAKGTQRPTSSNVNFSAGQTVPNLVIVPVSADGYVELYNAGWESVDLLADVTGYFTRTASSGYTPMAPARFVDTREGLGTAKGQVAGQATFGTQISGLRGVPQGAKAVALNVTVTNPKEAGHLTVFPSGQAAPSTSSVNFTAGLTIANSVIVPVGPDGKISVRNGAWAGTDVIVDVVGYYSPESKGAYLPLAPERVLDTRDPESVVYGPLEGQSYIYVPFSDTEPSRSGFVLNTTVTNTNGDGYLTVSPDPNTWDQYVNGAEVWPTPPNSSNLNWTKGRTVPNLVQASTGANGIVDFWNRGWDDIDLVVDLFGYYDTK
ncbi:PKD domain-containing protein [Streptomyces sp. NPDC048258]|uniref:PKD domain-containing protein n=1 Tax=Streptomyces sp. NPDC048258 TaxID=3365527 RepID=UPI00371D0FDD